LNLLRRRRLGGSDRHPNIGAAFAGGSVQYMGIADNAALSMGAGVQLTVCAWVYPESFAAASILAGKWNGTAATTEYGLQVNTSGLMQLRVSDNTTIRTSNGVTLLLNTWNFVLAQYNGTNLFTALNGAAFTAGIAGADIQDGALAFRLGTMSTGGSPYTGRLDCVGIWKRSLTAGEFATLYNGGKGMAYADCPASLLTSLAAWYDLDDAGGSAATWIDRLGVSDLTAGAGAAAPTSAAGKR